MSQGQSDCIRRLPALFGPCDRRSECQSDDAGMDGATLGTLRPAQHQCVGGCDQLCVAGTGTALHAFDLNKLDGDIEVRFARVGESLKLLNEQTREFAGRYAGDCR